MTIIPTSLGLVAGICLYAGMFHLLVGLRRRWAAIHLSFAAFSLSIAAFSLGGITYREPSILGFIFSSKWQMSFLYLSSLSFIWFVAFYTGVRPRPVTFSLTALSVVILVLNITSPFSILYASVSGLETVLLPWGERILYPEATAHQLNWLLLLALLGNTGYVYYACYRQYRRGERRQALILTLGMLISGAAVIYDTLIDLEIIARSMYVLDYGFLALVVVMSLGLSDDLVQVGIFKQALVENERRWHSLLENVELAVFGINQQGRVNYLNPHFLKLSEYAPDEVLGRSFSHFVPKRHRSTLQELFEKAMAEERFYPHYQVPICTKSGRERIISWSSVRLRDRAGNLTGTLSIGVDMTDQLQAQAALRKSEERYRAIIEEQVEFVIRHLPDGSLTFANQSYCQHIGKSSAQLQSVNNLALTGGEAQAKLPSAKPALTPESPIVTREAQETNAGGEERSIRWIDRAIFDDQGQIIEFQSVGHDITEIRAAEAELQRHRGHLETLVEERTVELTTANKQLATEIVERKRSEETLYQRTVELSALRRIAHLVTATTNVWTTLIEVSQTVTELFNLSYTYVLVPESDQTRPTSMLGFERKHGPIYLTQIREPLKDMPLVDQVLQLGQSLTAEAESLDLSPTVRTFLDEEKVKVILLCPLLTQGRARGIMTMATDQAGRRFTSGEISLAETVASDIAAALENARLLKLAKETATAEERSRLARDLHDAVTQTIYSASLIAEALPTVWRRQPLEGERNLIKLRQLVRGALAEMRTLLFELRPSALETAELGLLLGQLGDVLTGNTRIPVQLTVDGEAELPIEVKVNLYRIAQEAFNNIAKHSGATQVRATLMTRHQQLNLKIWDDGRGFDPSVILGERLGLQIIRERAASIGAQLNIESSPGQGCEVAVIWPVPVGSD